MPRPHNEAMACCPRSASMTLGMAPASFVGRPAVAQGLGDVGVDACAAGPGPSGFLESSASFLARASIGSS